VSSAHQPHPAGSIIAADDVVVTPAMLESVAARVRARIASYFPGTPLDSSSARVSIRPLGETSSYPLFLADAHAPDGTARAIVIKFAPVFEENNEGLTEYRHLRTMHDRLGPGGELRVPRPLDFYEDVNALLTERAGGERFSRRLLRDGGRLAGRDAVHRLEAGVRRCGAWLAVYHDATRQGEAAPFGDEFVARVDEKLALFTRHGFGSGSARRVLDTTRALREFGRDRRVAVADQHGDYGPQNAHVGEDFVCVFDLNYHASAPVYEDIDYFLVTLETMNPYPRQLLFDRRRVRALREPFLAGYFGTHGRPPLAEVLLAGYYLKSLLFRCAKQRRNTAKRGRAALRFFDAARTRRYYPQRLEAQCNRVDALLAGPQGRGSA
jgi:hypothetical protein